MREKNFSISKGRVVFSLVIFFSLVAAFLILFLVNKKTGFLDSLSSRFF